MIDKYLEDENEAFRKLEKAGFTEEQIDAIYHYVEFKLEYQNEYRDTVLEDAETKLRSELRIHDHVNGKVVRPV